MRLDWALIAKSALAVGGMPPSILAAGMTSVATPPRSALPLEVQKQFTDGAVAGPIPIALVVGLLCSRAESGRPQTFEVTVTDLDGSERFKTAAQMIVPPAPPDTPNGMDIAISAVVEINFSILRFDTHSVNLFINGTLAKQMPLNVRAAQVPPQARPT